jgi:hypothetical protein
LGKKSVEDVRGEIKKYGDEPVDNFIEELKEKRERLKKALGNDKHKSMRKRRSSLFSNRNFVGMTN